MAPRRTGRHAELALQARVVVDGGRVGVDGRVHEHRPQDHEAAERGMDEVAVDSDAAQPCGGGDRLVRDDPHLARKALHLHGEARRRVQRPHPAALQRLHEAAPDLVDLVGGVVELDVGHGALRRAQALAVHAPDEAHQRPRVREGPQDVRALVGDLRAIDLDEADVVGAGVERDPPEPCRLQDDALAGLEPRGGGGALTMPLDGGMLLESRHGRAPFVICRYNYLSEKNVRRGQAPAAAVKSTRAAWIRSQSRSPRTLLSRCCARSQWGRTRSSSLRPAAVSWR